MASQRPGQASGGTAGAANPAGAPAARGRSGGAAARQTPASKSAAGKAQARAARAAAAQAAQSPPEPAPSLARRLRARLPDGLPDAPVWLQWTTWALALAALGVSIYLTIVELAPHTLVCSSTGLVNCANVLHSPEGKIVGIPVAFFGLAFYLGMIVLNSPWAWRRRELLVRRLRLASFVIGMCFVLYLIYAELIEIGNICIWCTSVHAITFLLFVLIVFDSTFRQASTTQPAARLR
jgi:uncharacterized membrane protein